LLTCIGPFVNFSNPELLYQEMKSFKQAYMKIAILGTGTVGQTLAARLTGLHHEVMLGTRNVAETSARTTKDNYGGPSFSEWHANNKQVKLGTFSQAAVFGEILFSATQGSITLKALQLAGASNLEGKVLVDVSNPLDFSKGMPPILIPELCNTTSLGEEIQRTFPGVKVVKALNTMWCGLMVNPGMIGGGDHQVFVCGNDAQAKLKVTGLVEQFGWKAENILDLGDITAARGTEMLLPVWLKIMGKLGNSAFNFKVVKSD
jgi:predicted dinucleotide-binding enzyme